ncbi:MAG: hypothetical protein HOI43_08070 [Gammaproteobacteria bacterium]|nr:hypothetical protein [Gammaproteobacteria bacterium]
MRASDSKAALLLRLSYRSGGIKRGLCLLGLVFLSSCGGGSEDSSSAIQPPVTSAPKTGLLIPFETDEQLLSSLQVSLKRELAAVQQRQLLSAELSASDTDTGSSGGGFTTTYTQEASIDEHDVIKYDGNRLFIAPTRSLSCCFIVDDALPEGVVADGATEETLADAAVPAIRIMTTSPESAEIEETGRIELSDDHAVEGLYLNEDRLTTITSSAWWGSYGRVFDDLTTWQEQTSGLNVYDVGSPENTLLSQVKIEGVLITSRKTAEGIYLISRHTPDIEGLNYYPETDEDLEVNQAVLDALTIDELLPEVTVDGSLVDVLDPDQCYGIDADHELAPLELGFPAITSILLFDPQQGAIKDVRCYAESTNGVYVSENALYFTQLHSVESDSGERQMTLIHRFDLENLAYSGSGEVSGGLFLGDNRDFRISEYNDNLRMVTSRFTGDDTDLWEHQLFVLAPSSDEPALEVISQLPNAENPTALGKENEDLYGVRFLAERAYLVTFERIDPLYAIDLSDPSDPVIAGELEVTGFSNFLHPITENLLLGLGLSENGLAKLELFDVTDLNQPVSRTALEAGLDLDYSYSSAEYDRHGFTYQGLNDAADRLAIPVSGWGSGEAGFVSAERLYLYEVSDKETPDLAGLTEMGYLNVQNLGPGQYASSQSRSIIHDDAVYFINGEFVFSTFWQDPAGQQGPH